MIIPGDEFEGKVSDKGVHVRKEFVEMQCGQIKKIGWESKPNRGNLYIP